jgi:molybdopterin converting factor small subunit
MTVYVRLYSILRDKAGAPQLSLELPEGSRVGDLLQSLRGEGYAALDSFITDESGELKPHVKLVEQGRLRGQDPSAPLEDGQTYDLFVLTSGG